MAAAFLSDKAVVGQPGDIHTSAQNPLGLICPGVDANGYYGEWIYLTGVAATVLGSWVTYDEAGLTILTVADAQGDVAVASGAIVAANFGWYQITGNVSALCLTAFADNGKVYLTSTAGSVDDADVAGDFVVGAIGRSARDTTTGRATFQISRPKVQDTAFD